MSETPCPFCGQIHGTACNATGDATIPAVVPDAQRYDWREDWNRVQTRIGYDEDAHVDAMHRLAAYIERLETALTAHQSGEYAAVKDMQRLAAERDALLAEHEAAGAHMLAWDTMEEAVEERREALYEADHGQFLSEQYKEELTTAIREANVAEHRTADALRASHDNAERVIRGE